MFIDWLAIAEKFGIPLVGLGFLSLFFWKSVWPWIIKRFDRSEEERREERRAFIDALRTRDDKEDTERSLLITNFMKSINQRDVVLRELTNSVASSTAASIEAMKAVTEQVNETTKVVKELKGTVDIHTDAINRMADVLDNSKTTANRRRRNG